MLALRDGRQVIVLLPEIALTADWLDRFQRRFGTPPVVWHSDLPMSERRRNWRAVLRGGAKLVVGARSALMLPFRDLGLIVIDVVDNGIGLPTTNRSRLLEPYVTTREKGTGLGLAIVGKVLEDHGGGIELGDASSMRPGQRGAWMRLRFAISGHKPDAEQGDAKALRANDTKIEAVTGT